MKFTSTNLLVWFAFWICSVRAEDTIQGICNGIKGIYNCQTKFDLPTGAKSKMCPNKFFETDPCKTKYKYRYPCPTWSKPGRMCDGWTCVPGTREKWIDVPCGIDIMTKKVDLCETVRGTMGNVGAQFITKTTAMCECLPQALSMVTEGLFDSISDGDDLSDAVSTFVRDLIKVQKASFLLNLNLLKSSNNVDQQCMMDNGFEIKENKADLMSGVLSTSDGYTVLKAAEIDLVKYGELAAALSTCVFSCDIELITDFFTNYISESQALMSDQVTSFLSIWVGLFNTIETNLENVGEMIGDFFAGLETIPAKIKAIEGRVCTEKACIGPVISAFRQKVSEAISTSKLLQEVITAMGDIKADVPKLMQTVNATIEGIKAIPEINSIMDLITNIQRIEDILQVINVARDLPKLAEDIKKDGGTIVDFVTTYSARGSNALTLCQDIVSTAWESYPMEFTTDSSGNVRAGLAEIQSIVEEEITKPLQNITEAFNILDSTLSSLPIRNGVLNIDKGVASYQRWSYVSMDMPCSKMSTAQYSIAGFSGSFSYPEFWSCPYGPKKVPWPNHHIPYIKFRVS